MKNAVEAQDLQKTFKATKGGQDFQAVKAISFSIPAGICYGFLGPNGAGKTTTMRMIYRSTHVSGGTLDVLGLDAASRRNDREIKRKLGVVPQLDNLDQELTTEETLRVFCRFYKLGKQETETRVTELLAFADLTDKATQKVITLSGGMRRRLLVARGLINDPDLLILDEPTTGLDPRARETLWEQLSKLKEKGVTLILTTHYMREAERLCDIIAVMDEGKIVAEDSPEKLIEKHVSKTVIEISNADPTELLDAISDDIHKIESLQDRKLVYCKNPHIVLDALSSIRDAATILVRPASLEDVFLALTGKGLA